MADRLASIRKQIVALEKRATELLKVENKKIIDRIKSLIAKHQLTAEDLGLGGFGGKAAAGAEAPARKGRGAKRAAAGKKAGLTVGVPMYRDPKSGKTWTGRGKPPNWIVKAKDRTPFLIVNGTGGGSDAAAEVPAKGRKARAADKATPKAAKKPAAKKAAARKATAKRAAKVPAAPKPPKAVKAPRKAAKKAAAKRGAKGPGRTAPPPPAPAAAASTEA